MKNIRIKDRQNASDQGFTVVEGLIILVVVIIIAGIGYYVMNKYKQGTDKTASTVSTSSPSPSPSNANKTSYTYPGGLFSVSYPKTWKQTYQMGPTDAQDSPDNFQNKVVVLTQPNAPMTLSREPIGVDLMVFKSGNTADILKNVNGGTLIKNQKTLTINGYSAMTQQNVPDTTGGKISVPSSYTDNLYAVTHNNMTVVVVFRLKEGAVPATDSGTGKAVPAFDQTALLPYINGIVYSIKF